MSHVRSSLLLSLFIFATGCGGIIDDESSAGAASRTETPPPVATRFELRVDGKRVDLEAPHGTRYVVALDGASSTYITIGAQQDPGVGDYIQSANVSLSEPFRTGSFDCTPNERGETTKGATLNPGTFFGFKATLTDCIVEVSYVTNDRVVGKFSTNAHPPAGSSLGGKVSKAEGEFDVPLQERKLP